MMVDSYIQSYGISFELTKPNHSSPAFLVPWCWSSTFFVNSGLDPEFFILFVLMLKNQENSTHRIVEHVHMNVTSLANSQSRALVKG